MPTENPAKIENATQNWEAQANQKIDQLTNDLAEAQKIIDELIAKNSELTGYLEEATVIISELKANGNGKTNSEVTVTIDKKVYMVTKGFREKDKEWLPEDIAANPAVAKKLLEKKSNILKLK